MGQVSTKAIVAGVAGALGSCCNNASANGTSSG